MKKQNNLVDTSFVEKEFYSEPPSSKASVDEWNSWLKHEAKLRAAHKAQHTKMLKHEQIPDYQETVMSKVGGVWRQGNILMGLIGDADDNTLIGELGEQPKQEHHIALINMEAVRHKRGGNRKGRSARRRANRK